MKNPIDSIKIKDGLRVIDPSNDGKLLTSLNSCVHCGLCAESCIYYLSTGNEKYIPANKVEAVTSIFRRYYTLTGKIMPSLSNAKELNDETVEEMIDLLYGACTMCGRCNMHCSIGVDIEYLVRKGREMLAIMDLVPESLQSTVNAAITTGNNMGINEEDFIDTLKWLEEDLQDEVNDPNARIPLNEHGTDILYCLNPREPKFFPLSISAMAKVFYAAGASWTVSTKMYDVTNYGYFSGNMEEATLIAERMHQEMTNLGAKRLILAECGHGSRALRWEAPNYVGEKYKYETITSVELLADYIKKGKIKVDNQKIKQKVTLHDPCNLVRGGGIFQEQRYILKNTVSDFTEMTPYGIDNYCCGGGGGQLAMGEYNDRRLKTAKIKADQISKTGAKIVVTPCHNCVDQLMQTNSNFKLGIQIKTMTEIVADSLVLDNNK